jgi:hypothetical protein
MMKWKPDYLMAEPCFKNAAKLFRAAGMQDSALDALKKAAMCSAKLGNVKQASLTLETAARDAGLSKDPAGKSIASELYVEAAEYLIEAGETVRASDVLLLAGKMLEGFDKNGASKLFDRAAELFDGDEDKDVYAVQPLQKILREQLTVGKHASSMKTIEKLIAIYRRLNQPHNVHKALLSRVILILAAADPVGAQREYERCLDIDSFAASDEAAAAEDMIGCYTEMNSDALKSVVNRNVINYLDAPIAKLAKGLPSAVLAGTQVGVASENEAATKAIAQASRGGSAGLDNFREFGSGSAIGGYDSKGQDTKAKAAASKDSNTRSALFSKPSGQSSVTSAAAKIAKAKTPEPEPEPEPEEEEQNDFDLEAEAHGMSLGEAGPAEDYGHDEYDQEQEQEQEQQQEEEEDLGLM